MSTRVRFIITFSEKLEIAKKCDLTVKESIMDSIKYFELLGLSRDSLKNRIPVKSDEGSLKNSEEASSLRKDLDELDKLKEKCQEIIEKVFQVLNEDNVIPQFINVLKKKTTEKAVFRKLLSFRFLQITSPNSILCSKSLKSLQLQ